MAKDKEDKKDKDEDEGEALTIVTDHEDDLDVPPTGEQVAMETVDTEPKKKKVAAGANGHDKDEEEDESDEEEPEDKRLGASDENDEEDQRRTSHKSRRQRKKEAEARLRLERDFLEKRNEALERKLAETLKGTDERIGAVEKSNLDQRIAQAKGIIKKAETVIADAITNQKGDEAAEATRIRDEWRDHLKDLETSRVSMDEEDKEGKEHKPPPANPRVVAQAQKWHQKNSWYDFQNRDLDSKVVSLIDQQVAQEGYDPMTEEYWDEVTKRAKALIPHRFKVKKKAKDDTDDEDEDVEDVADDEDEEDEKPKPKKGGKPKPKTGGPRFRTGRAQGSRCLGRSQAQKQVLAEVQRVGRPAPRFG